MKQKTWVKRWAVTPSMPGIVDFYHRARPRAVDSTAQMSYQQFMSIFGIPLEPERVYSLKVKGTARPS